MGPLGAQDPNVQGGQFDDVKQAIAMMMEQQQAGGGPPRPPTDSEAAQLKQKAMEMIQQKKAAGGMNPGAPTPPPAAGAATPPPPGQPPMGGPPPGPANVPPASGPNSANEAMDQLLMSAKAQSPLTKDVKPNITAQRDDTLASIDATLEAARQQQIDRRDRKVNASVGDASAIIHAQQHPQDQGPSWGAFGPQNTPPINIPSLTGTGVDFNKPSLSIPTSPSNQEAASTPQATQAPGQQPQMSDEELDEAMKRIHSDTPSNTLPNNGQPFPGKDETPGDEDEGRQIAEKASAVADKAQAAGVDSPDKAKVWLGNNHPEFKSLMDDPEYKALLDKYEKEYNDAKTRTDQAGPGATQYIAAALLGLAGVHPQVIQSVLHGDQAKYQGREQLAGERLMQAQLHGLSDRQASYRQNSQQAKLDEQQAIANMKEAGINRREDQKFQFDRLKFEREQNSNILKEFIREASQAVTTKQKTEVAQKYAPFLKKENEYRVRMGGQPFTEQEMKQMLQTGVVPTGASQPQSMAPRGQPQQPNQGMQQSALRLIGLGA